MAAGKASVLPLLQPEVAVRNGKCKRRHSRACGEQGCASASRTADPLDHLGNSLKVQVPEFKSDLVHRHLWGSGGEGRNLVFKKANNRKTQPGDSHDKSVRWPLCSLWDSGSVILIIPSKWVRAQNYYAEWGNLWFPVFRSWGREVSHNGHYPIN